MKRAGSKGQRSIASFFQNPKSSQQQDTTAAPKPDDGAPPAKRAKLATAAAQPAHAIPHNQKHTEDGSSAAVTHSEERQPGAGAIPTRTAARQIKAHRKLVESEKQQQQAAEKPAKIKYTPLEQQVVDLKIQHPDVLLVVEVGYKFRFFGEDAEIASRICNIYCFPDHNFMTASIPVHRLPIHVRRLVAAGHKVGVVRQVETAALKAAGSNKNAPFERKLTALYTSSTLDAGEKADKVGEEGAMGTSQEMEALLSGTGGRHNYLLCVAEEPTQQQEASQVGLVAVESSTGDVLYGLCSTGLVQSQLEAALLAIAPVEVLAVGQLTQQTQRIINSYLASASGSRREDVADAGYLGAAVVDKLQAFYQEQQDADFILGLPAAILRALAAAVDYLERVNLQGVLRLVGSFRPLEPKQEMQLSANALRQLEVLSCQDGSRKGSLLHLMDCTVTAAGSRLLQQWLSRPLTDRALILQRLEAVDELAGRSDSASAGLAAVLPELLRALPDLERGITRIFHRTAAPAEFVVVLQALVKVGDKLGGSSSSCSSSLVRSLLQLAADGEVSALCSELLAAIDVKAAATNDYSKLFASEQRFPDVFRCQRNVVAAEQHLQQLLPQLAQAAGVRRLEYRSVQNQGDWLVELPAERQDVPAGWEKVTTTKKVCRYHPPEVKAGMQQLEVCKELLQAACAQAWSHFLGDFGGSYSRCRQAVAALAHLDALLALATLSQTPGYCRPQFVEDDEPPQLCIAGGRHPMLDAQLAGGCVPASLQLSWGSQRAAIITGPNMGGKSCLIRQAALMVVMAQAGSYVPAESLSLHVHDCVFTRMGASDNLLMGRSTFMEELGDAAQVLSCATRRSLVILDELGRGTSTHDGVAIASATLQHLAAQLQCLTLFVTHYPEVAAMGQQQQQQGEMEHVGVYHMAYLRADEQQPAAETAEPAAVAAPRIVFLYRLTPGAADQSFGLNVAQLAGLPAAVVARAAHIAAEFKQRLDAGAAEAGARNRRRGLVRELGGVVRGGVAEGDALLQLQAAAREAAAAVGGQ